jgi:MSHA type pilus biogenesis protein MshL
MKPAHDKENPMVRLLAILIATLTLIASGCSWGPASIARSRTHDSQHTPSQIAAESAALDRVQKQIHRKMEKVTAKQAPAMEPVVPVYDPFEGQTVSFSVVDEPLQTVLYSLSQAVGVNIIINPAVLDEQRKLTLSFDKASASTVLNEILSAYDLAYEVSGNVIKVGPYSEQIFHLDFLDSNIAGKFEVGGDVLGASESDKSVGLSGSFKLTGESTRQNNAYDILEGMLRPLVSKDGKLSINRLSGSLYIKDRPHVVQSVARLIRHYKSMLRRQILIEARIIEVGLSDRYSYGIDWSVLRNLADASTEVTGASWSLGSGLIMTGTSGEFSINTAVNALRIFGDTKVVSNPTIRSKHGMPAIISVGTSYSYKKSVETTRTTTGTSEDNSTQVEVSTVFDGLILGVVAFIDDSGGITLLINPIKSDVDQTSLDDQQVGEGLSIALPRVSIKEISSTIALHDGDVAVLGGLIDKRKVVDNRGVPFLSGIPLLGHLFKNEDMRDETRELVILLRVKIV